MKENIQTIGYLLTHYKFPKQLDHKLELISWKDGEITYTMTKAGYEFWNNKFR